MYKEIDSNKRRTYFLMAVFLILIIFIGWVFSYIYDSYSILVFAVLIAFLQSWVSYFYSDKIVIAMAGAKEVKKKEEPELHRIVENLCITAGLPVPKVHIIEDQAMNAFATGRDPEHASIAVTRGLLNKLEKREIEGVVAHEMSHIGNRDILLQTVVVTLVGVIVLISDFFLRFSFFGFSGRRRDRSGGGEFGAIMVLIGLVLAILSPLFAKLIQLAISRKREYLADSTGSLMTRFPEGLASALEKISADEMPMLRFSKATAHLYISDPVKSMPKAQKSFLTLFSTHPPIEDRIAKLKGMEKK